MRDTIALRLILNTPLAALQLRRHQVNHLDCIERSWVLQPASILNFENHAGTLQKIV